MSVHRLPSTRGAAGDSWLAQLHALQAVDDGRILHILGRKNYQSRSQGTAADSALEAFEPLVFNNLTRLSAAALAEIAGRFR